ncbi:phage capsid protein (plasmid) [Lactobacillus brevis] [Lactiplantibacillus mudanjiangensis]|uniref:phage capsid protein n=1 Tax=Lactiplantibacillus mudanjiangensis TaxID=1296538 RepID=UPI001014DE62|nr:phage capsid protein [Lactiplantibacillus mudanjiangensis]VDG31403.1 phage capsid protein (plasmid) [Lactobacillus brevis] [Lactiplantibacillus mudanjiangensis]
MATITGNVTDLSANFIPEVWLDWVYDRITKTNNFFKSGIIAQDPILGNQLLQPGLYVTIPHMNAIDTSLATQVWNNKNDITTNGMTSGTENDVKIYEAQSFGNSDYDDLVTGAKTLDQITAQFTDYWGVVDTQRLIQVLNAAFLNADIATAKSFNVGKEKVFAATDFVKSMARMGDVNSGKPTQIAVNSGTYNYMVQNNLIEYTQPSVGATPIANYNGLTIVQDDQIPLDAKGTTAAYIFGSGAVNYSVATPQNGVTTDRDNLKQGGISAITHKRVVTTHMAGTAADMTVESDPTKWKDDLIGGSKALYKPVNDVRNIHVIKYGFTIDPDYVIKGVNSEVAASTTTTGSTTTPTPSK